MTRKANNTKGLGRSILIAKKQQADRLRAQAEKLAGNLGVGIASGGSVLEQSNLDDLIATVELKKEVWAEGTGEAEIVKAAPAVALNSNANAAAEREASRRRELISIPRRPKWHAGMSVEELQEKETEAFMEWRRGLVKAAEEEGLYLTPYERNLDFWRQLWRCIERCDLLVQIVDARDPDFYMCRDLVRYINEVDSNKKLMILVNKADFLSDETRAAWKEYFQAQGIDAVFFSALHELRRQQKEQQQQLLPNRHGVRGGAADEGPTDLDDDVDRRRAAGVFSKVIMEEDEQEEHAEVAAGNVNPVHIPVPGLDDSDDDLASEDGDDKPKADDTNAPEDSDDEDEPTLGPHADDEFDGVADASRLVEELLARLSSGGPDAIGGDGDSTQATIRRGTVGFVGYPNVGKSTVINALVGKTKVGMSRTPGKTKHIQTLELADFGITLCDCPGLVFPSVAATKAHLVINNTVHIDDLRECFSPITLIVEKVGWKAILDRYDCAHAVQDARSRSGDHVLDDTHAFLAALAVSRHHLLRVGVPDENWAARKVLKDYVSGALLHCELPPSAAAPAASSTAPAADGAEDDDAESESEEEEDEDDFGDVPAFLREARPARKERGMTKRKMRMMKKLAIKGKGPPVFEADNVGVVMNFCHRA